ncbi:chromate efflux transporter [Thaumasiovibrio subtropicus]|uniref:chromate efflux transporter n=1 Tax=Thaumasiovibrio subtropicus TaxID=1891207 RepID=UPI000B354C56|nr:chromate efflux transporter [Thaumasiovibrio subtropicus]
MTVFIQFFLLGLYSFGGPAAHIGFFQREFVEKRAWIDQATFTQAVALCQFLPGPASSQLGMFIGYKKGGYWGALSAFIGFTFPSFLLLTVFAVASTRGLEQSMAISVFMGAAKWLAVVVVLDAVWGMGKKNIRTKAHWIILLATAAWLSLTSGLLAQVTPIVLVAVIGYAVTKPSEQRSLTKWRPNWLLLIMFAVLLLCLPLASALSPSIHLFNLFYQAGSFVFGGGHVVLPLLEPMLDGLVTSDVFISGYASAQLVPGPMFTMASYLGASAMPEIPIWGSIVATLAVFLPGALLLFAMVPAWESLMTHPRLKASIDWVNATVVGLLAVAFVDPIATSAIHGVKDVVGCAIGWCLLKYARLPVWGVIITLLLLRAGFELI